MKNENYKKINMKDVFNMIISFILALGLLIGAYFTITHESPRKMNEIEENIVTSDMISTIPEETASRFIKVNGTMGNLEKDITQDKMKTGEAISENSNRRLIALAKAKEAIIPGSPLISGAEESNIKMFARDLVSPYIYTIQNVRVSEPSNLRKLAVYTETGPTEYEAVDVYAYFDSTRINFTSARDTSYDGTHTQLNNTESFDNMKIVLVKSGDLWFVYDVEDSEYIINERFATWSGIGVSSIDYSNNVESGIFKIEGITPIDESLEYDILEEEQYNE